MKLGDFIGALMKEATLARLQADLESARAVEVYRNHPLLEGAAIPRFRLPEITIEVPLVIDGAEEELEEPMIVLHSPPTMAELEKAVREAQAASGVTLKKKERADITDKLFKQAKVEWPKPIALSLALQNNKRLSIGASETLRTIKEARLRRARKAEPRPPEEGSAEGAPQTAMSEASLKAFKNAVSASLLTRVMGTIGETLRVKVLTNTAAVREVGDDTMLTRLILNLHEDGFESVRIERSDGSVDERLVPE